MVVLLGVMITLLLVIVGGLAYLIFLQWHRVGEVTVAPVPKTFPTISLYLMGSDDVLRHEVSLHVQRPPLTYTYGDVTYRFVDVTQTGVLRYRAK